MSKLGCLCGHTIVDQTNDIAYKGYILPDTLVNSFFDVLTENMNSLATAKKSNNTLEWMKKNFSVPPYPLDASDADMIHDLLFNAFVNTNQDIYECENCGRVAIQIKGINKFNFYYPENNQSKGIINGKDLVG